MTGVHVGAAGHGSAQGVFAGFQWRLIDWHQSENVTCHAADLHRTGPVRLEDLAGGRVACRNDSKQSFISAACESNDSPVHGGRVPEVESHMLPVDLKIRVTAAQWHFVLPASQERKARE